MNTTETGRSMLSNEMDKQVTSPEKSSRSLWAVSMCSLVAIASLSAVLYADRTRIAQLEEELSRSHEVLNKPEVMQRVLALAQVDGSSGSVSGSSASISGSSASISGSSGSMSGSSSHISGSSSSSSSTSRSSSTSISGDLSYSSSTTVDVNVSGAKMSTHTLEEDIVIIQEFSASLHDTLMRLDKRITTIDAEWQTSQASFTHLESDVDILISETDQIKIDVTTLMNNYDSLYIDIEAQ